MENQKESEKLYKLSVFRVDAKTGQTIWEDIPIRVVKSKRKTLGITVDEQAQGTVRIPLHASVRSGMEYAQEKSNWIVEKVLLQRERKQQRDRIAARSEENMSPAQRQALRKRYITAAHTYFPQRCAYYAGLLGVTYGKIRIAEQKTRWGSCSTSGTLSFNWKLMLAPPRVLDYVVVHELCHLIEMNHSKRFWSLVESVMPEYKEYRKWLKENGDTLQLS